MASRSGLFAGCFVTVLCAVAAAFAAEPTPDEAAIHEAAVKFVDAYNAKDAAAIAALFTPGARFEEADGTVVEGREAIQAAFEAAFAADPDSQIGLTIDSLTLLTPDVAVEQGLTENFPDGETLVSRGRYLVVHLKRDGVWAMAAARSMEPEVLSNYAYLQPLEWLVGDWIDEDADAVIETSARWDEGRNFLVQEYQVRRGSQVVEKGTQRLGWDPVARQVRGWIFDSEGGFGESLWTEAGGAWVVTTTAVRPDGGRVSSTRTLLPSGDRVEVHVAQRVDAGEPQPDLDFTMVRRPPGAASAE
ncbi:MAG: SgcJ/EcaC family oxidoreductase [Planctomyces sp.]|nr:SgcJ/EcaC family oxidoreductase [Planctomyces sp.]